jgi:hypothetical protein
MRIFKVGEMVTFVPNPFYDGTFKVLKVTDMLDEEITYNPVTGIGVGHRQLLTIDDGDAPHSIAAPGRPRVYSGAWFDETL